MVGHYRKLHLFAEEKHCFELGEAARAQSRSPLIQPRADRRTDVYHLAYDRQRL